MLKKMFSVIQFDPFVPTRRHKAGRRQSLFTEKKISGAGKLATNKG